MHSGGIRHFQRLTSLSTGNTGYILHERPIMRIEILFLFLQENWDRATFNKLHEIKRFLEKIPFIDH